LFGLGHHASWLGAIVVALAAGLSMLVCGLIWIMAGRPSAEGLLRRHPASTVAAVAVLMVGLIPALLVAPR
jgi:hypothetical protein